MPSSLFQLGSPGRGPSGADHTVFGHLQERFELRAKTLVYARLAFMSIALAVLAIPAWRHSLNVPFDYALGAYLTLLAIHVSSFLWVGRRHARVVLFVSLCVDLAALVYAVAASGGIRSPLMPTQLVLTMIFALLFPSPLAIVPPLLMLPTVARLDQLLGIQALPGDLMLLLWYSALNVIVVYIVVYLDGREKLAFDEVIRMQRERRQQALASQRTRIAREIHDGVGAALSGVVLQAEYLVEQADSGELSRELQELREAASDGMEELRRAVSILHREFQLSSSVPDYVDSFAARHRVAATCEIEGQESDLDAELALALFRVLQEALSNVARHAAAKTVQVRLKFEADQIKLEVEDDGRGFVPESVVGAHYGLRHIGDRAGRLGGQLHVHSRPDEGTRIEVRVPPRQG